SVIGILLLSTLLFSLSKSNYFSPTGFLLITCACVHQKRVRAVGGRVTATRAPIAHVRSELSARALHKKEYARVRGELPARAPPPRTCGGCSPRVRSTKKSTCTCGASYRHARPHRARAEEVPRACATQKRVRPRVGRVTGTRTPIVHVRSEFSARVRGIIYQKWVFFAISS